MRFLADENFPRPAISALILAGHDVICVADKSPGASDKEIFDWAVKDDRVVLTLDKDFGELSTTSLATDRCGIILFREPVPPKSEIGVFMTDLVNSRKDWGGHLVVVEGTRLRRRPLKVSL